jgi:hypothetical protein
MSDAPVAVPRIIDGLRVALVRLKAAGVSGISIKPPLYVRLARDADAVSENLGADLHFAGYSDEEIIEDRMLDGWRIRDIKITLDDTLEQERSIDAMMRL